MTRRPRILFLSQCLPYPPHSGVRARTYNILDQLRADFDVTLLAFSRRGHQRNATARLEAERALGAMLDQVTPAIPVPAEESRLRRFLDHLRSLAMERPYTIYEYDSTRFRRQLRGVLARGSFDLVHLDSPDLAGWIEELPPVPVTCTHHSIESQLLRRQAQQVRYWLLRCYILWQADLLEGVERTMGPRFHLNLMMSETEARVLRDLAPGSRTAVVPNGVDVSYFAPQPGAPVVDGSVVFVGSTDMFPNRDAVEYALSEVWPLIRRACPEATLSLIGGVNAAARARYHAAPGVRALGYVADVRPHLAGAACCIVPLRVGGGTRLKILDAWAMGRPVVSTSVGCEGLDAVDARNILIRDDARGFAGAVVDTLKDPGLRARLGVNGRATAVRTYGWDVVGQELRSAYWEILGVRPPAGPVTPPADTLTAGAARP
jgi:glycosyltransferase involved in cell wall biosynthesis